MTRLAQMPFGAWPRGLSWEQAAAYAGVSPGKFRGEVKAGLWPEPEKRGSRNVFDRHRIDEAWDNRQQAEGGADPLMEALSDRTA